MRRTSFLVVLGLACVITLSSCGRKEEPIAQSQQVAPEEVAQVISEDLGGGVHFLYFQTRNYSEHQARTAERMARAIANVIKEHPGSTVASLTGDNLNGTNNGFFLVLNLPSK